MDQIHLQQISPETSRASLNPSRAIHPQSHLSHAPRILHITAVLRTTSLKLVNKEHRPVLPTVCQSHLPPTAASRTFTPAVPSIMPYFLISSESPSTTAQRPLLLPLLSRCPLLVASATQHQSRSLPLPTSIPCRACPGQKSTGSHWTAPYVTRIRAGVPLASVDLLMYRACHTLGSPS